MQTPTRAPTIKTRSPEKCLLYRMVAMVVVTTTKRVEDTEDALDSKGIDTNKAINIL